VDWRAGMEFDVTEDFLAYGTITTGHRAGGINRPLTLASGTVLAREWAPETLVNYELGVKNTLELFDRPLRFNAAAFLYDYEDKVVQNLVAVPTPRPDAPNAVTNHVFSDNSADARVLGLELDGVMVLPRGFQLGWNVAYLDSEFDNSALYDDRSGLLVNIDGNVLPQTSKYNANLRFGQTLGVNWGSVSSLDWTLNLLYRSKYYLTPFNSKGYALDDNGNQIEVPLAMLTPNDNDALTPSGGTVDGRFFSDEVDAFAQINLSGGMNFGAEERFRIDGFITNLTEEAYSGKGFINSSVNIRFLNAPRTYGLRLRAAF
jgi:iron complex outermembrane receptor protein